MCVRKAHTMSKTATPARKLLDLEGAGEYLGLSGRAVRRMVAEGRLRAYRIGNGPKAHIRIDVADVDALLVPTVTS